MREFIYIPAKRSEGSNRVGFFRIAKELLTPAQLTFHKATSKLDPKDPASRVTAAIALNNLYPNH